MRTDSTKTVADITRRFFTDYYSDDYNDLAAKCSLHSRAVDDYNRYSYSLACKNIGYGGCSESFPHLCVVSMSLRLAGNHRV
jgi:hypothetical protein